MKSNYWINWEMQVISWREGEVSVITTDIMISRSRLKASTRSNRTTKEYWLCEGIKRLKWNKIIIIKVVRKRQSNQKGRKLINNSQNQCKQFITIKQSFTKIDLLTKSTHFQNTENLTKGKLTFTDSTVKVMRNMGPNLKHQSLAYNFMDPNS